MITIVLCALVAAALFLFFSRGFTYLQDKIFGVVSFAFVGGLIGLAFSLVAGSFVPKEWIQTQTTELVSLRSGDSLSGSHFLGSGSIGASSYYFYYRKDGEAYVPGKVRDDDNVRIIEREGKAGELRSYRLGFVDPSYHWYFLMGRETKYEFVIPVGSLKQNFVVQ